MAVIHCSSILRLLCLRLLRLRLLHLRLSRLRLLRPTRAYCDCAACCRRLDQSTVHGYITGARRELFVYLLYHGLQIVR